MPTEPSHGVMVSTLDPESSRERPAHHSPSEAETKEPKCRLLECKSLGATRSPSARRSQSPSCPCPLAQTAATSSPPRPHPRPRLVLRAGCGTETGSAPWGDSLSFTAPSTWAARFPQGKHRVPCVPMLATDFANVLETETLAFTVA